MVLNGIGTYVTLIVARLVVREAAMGRVDVVGCGDGGGFQLRDVRLLILDGGGMMH